MASLPTEWTVLRLLEWTKDFFTRNAVEDARLCAEVLLAHVLGCPRLGLYTQFDRIPAPEQLTAFRELVKRAGAGEPIAYLTGQRDFYSLAFDVTPDVLIPRPETEMLVDLALEYVKANPARRRLWDVCTGSGCVAVASAVYCPDLRVLATDVSAAALAVADKNVGRHKVAERVTLAEADLLKLPPGQEGGWDIILSNPPYVSDAQMADLPKAVRAEPALALKAGKAGLDCITRIIADAPAVLAGGGLLAMEIGQGQGPAVYDLLNQAGAYEEIRLRKDAAGIERVAAAVRK